MKLNLKNISALCAVISSPTAMAATFTIQPLNEAASKETKVYASVPTSNFSSNLSVVSADITDFRSLIQFDLSPVAMLGANDISSAVIRLYVTGMNVNGQSSSTSAAVTLSPILGDWKETSADAGTAPLATWSNLFGASPTIGVGAVASTQTVTGIGYYDWDITALAKDWLSGNVTNYGVLIQAPGPLGDIGLADVDTDIDTVTAGNQFAPPALILQSVPEPTSFVLLGLAASIGLRRRR